MCVDEESSHLTGQNRFTYLFSGSMPHLPSGRIKIGETQLELHPALIWDEQRLQATNVLAFAYYMWRFTQHLSALPMLARQDRYNCQNLNLHLYNMLASLWVSSTTVSGPILYPNLAIVVHDLRAFESSIFSNHQQEYSLITQPASIKDGGRKYL